MDGWDSRNRPSSAASAPCASWLCRGIKGFAQLIIVGIQLKLVGRRKDGGGKYGEEISERHGSCLVKGIAHAGGDDL